MNRKLFTQLNFITLDAIGIIPCIVLAVLLKFGVNPPRESINVVLDFYYIILGTHLIIFTLGGLYKINRNSSMVDVIYKNFWVETLVILVLTIFFLTVRTYGFFNLYKPDLGTSRGLMFYIWFLVLLYITSWRLFYLAYYRNKWKLVTRVAVVGVPAETETIARSLENYSSSGHQVMGIISPKNYDSKRHFDFKVIDLAKMKDFVQQNQIHEIIIATNLPPNRLIEVIDICQETLCTLWIYPSLYEVMIGRLKIQEIAGIPLIEINPTLLTGWYRIGKRCLDIIVSFTGLILSIPLLILISLLIKLDSRGSIFYSQLRLGKNGKPFHIFKFRTMQQDAEKETGAILAVHNDPRITRVGKYLRKFRFDEIPQLISVLNGDMSLVGPRPERPELMDKFSLDTPHFHKRLAISPGLTGLAQIQGRYDMDIESKLRYDLAYIYNVNLLLDIKILFATIKVVFTGKGAR